MSEKRSHRTTLRFNADETLMLKTFAREQGVTISEAIRRLIFWKRLPDFVLPKPCLGDHPVE